MRGFRDAKVMAHALRDGLSAKAVEFTHSECLELLAKAFGCESWNVLSAKIEAKQSPAPDRHGHTSVAKKVLSCSFCGKTRHEVRELIAGPSIFVCDECVGLCNDIIDGNEFARLLEADEERGDRSYASALEYLRGKSAHVEAPQRGAERRRLDLQQIKRKLPMRDDDVVPETDVLATPRFAFLKYMTKEDLVARQHRLERDLKRYEDALPIVATVVGEREQD